MIPKSFCLAGLTITVKQKPLKNESDRCIGHADYQRQAIELTTGLVPLETLEQTFYHEEVHWILHIMGRDELRDDEKFVDMFAHLLYQAIKTGNESLM